MKSKLEEQKERESEILKQVFDHCQFILTKNGGLQSVEYILKYSREFSGETIENALEEYKESREKVLRSYRYNLDDLVFKKYIDGRYILQDILK